MTYFNIVSESEESTVVAEYQPQAVRSEALRTQPLSIFRYGMGAVLFYLHCREKRRN